MTITISIRSITGRTTWLNVDRESSVSDVKQLIASTTGKNTLLTLTYRGHELRGHRKLSYYDVTDRDILYFKPPSKLPKILLQFENVDCSQFSMEVPSDATVAQVRREIEVEEKMNAITLKYVSVTEDPDDHDILVVSDPQTMPDHALISWFPLEGVTIYTFAATYHVLIKEVDKPKLDVSVRAQMTIDDFREAVLRQHGVSLANCVLIVLGKEVSGDGMPIWNLGIIPDCTVHAAPFLEVHLEILWGRQFPSKHLHPLTKLSEIREMIEQDHATSVSTNQYWFTMDCCERLLETRTLWDLDFTSGHTLYLRNKLISVKIAGSHHTTPRQVDAEENETVWGLKERWILLSNLPLEAAGWRSIIYRGKVLDDTKTLNEEGLRGGEQLYCMTPPPSPSLASHWPW